ncbi:MAG: hypothetical protein HKN94_15500 [Acidimicrobiales bacterium]|nr:hypothetical protein [Acidimicrobiales bacterium]
MTEPLVSQRRVNSAARILAGEPEDAVRVLTRLKPEELAHVGEVVHQLERERAVAAGDHDQIIDLAFEEAFGSDGLGHPPWVQGAVIVAPGSIINKSKTNHRCRFISVNDTWVWDSIEVIREDKRSIPGTNEGFKAVALLPVLNGMTLDVVTGRARAGQHQVDRVVSYKVKRGKLVEVAQRNVKPQGMR